MVTDELQKEKCAHELIKEKYKKVNMHALFVQKSQNDIHDAKRLTLHAYITIFSLSVLISEYFKAK